MLHFLYESTLYENVSRKEWRCKYAIKAMNFNSWQQETKSNIWELIIYAFEILEYFSVLLLLGAKVPEIDNDHNHILPLEPKWPITNCDYLVVLRVSKFKIGYKIRKWCHERTYWQSSFSILKLYAEQSSLTKLHVNILKICQDSCVYLVTLHLTTVTTQCHTIFPAITDWMRLKQILTVLIYHYAFS